MGGCSTHHLNSAICRRGGAGRFATTDCPPDRLTRSMNGEMCCCSGPRKRRVWSNAKALSCRLSGVSWTRRTSWATSSRSLCLQKCGTGWPPPSPARWAWCCDATRRNLASAASCTPSRPEYLWRGKFVCEGRRIDWYVGLSSSLEELKVTLLTSLSCPPL